MSISRTFYHFAYASNLLRERILLYNPSAVFKAVAKLNDYTIAFTCLDKDPSISPWRGGKASLVYRPGNYVWGCVWELDLRDMETLDGQEPSYTAVIKSVTSLNGQNYNCRTFLVDPIPETKYDDRPSPQYKDVIIRGAQQNDLPQDYVKHLQTFQGNGFSGRVEIYEEILQQLEQQGPRKS